ncbi:MAG: hypothetical protein ACI9O0_000896 [Paracoccaceae bacterium]|jgi:hypothetical protein
MIKLADRLPYKKHATINDPNILDQLRAALQEISLAGQGL